MYLAVRCTTCPFVGSELSARESSALERKHRDMSRRITSTPPFVRSGPSFDAFYTGDEMNVNDEFTGILSDT